MGCIAKLNVTDVAFKTPKDTKEGSQKGRHADGQIQLSSQMPVDTTQIAPDPRLPGGSALTPQVRLL